MIDMAHGSASAARNDEIKYFPGADRNLNHSHVPRFPFSDQGLDTRTGDFSAHHRRLRISDTRRT